MGCASSSSLKGLPPQHKTEEEVRRCLSLEALDGPADKPSSSRPTTASSDDACEEERSLLLTLNQQDVLDLIQQAALLPRPDTGRPPAAGPGQAGPLKFCVASETDRDLNRAASFSSKQTAVRQAVPGNQAALNMAKVNIGYACRKGLKPEAPNQDSFFICQVEDEFSIYGVFDGHGRKGHDVSNFIKDCIPKLLLGRPNVMQNPMTVLKEVFLQTQRLIEQATNLGRLDATRSGSTASVVLHDHKKRILYTAHVGDSRCVLAKQAPDDSARSQQAEWKAIDLTEDHKPNLPAEKARIEQCGGQVRFDGGFNYRVYAKGKRYPGLNMSRAMGDLLGFHDAGISAEPDVLSTAICSQQDVDDATEDAAKAARRTAADSPSKGPSGLPSPRSADGGAMPRQHSFVPSVCSHEIDPMTDKFLLLCSDGVWEFMSSEEATLAVAGFKADQAMKAAEHLASTSWERWTHHMHGEVVDDITVLLVHLDANSQTKL